MIFKRKRSFGESSEQKFRFYIPILLGLLLFAGSSSAQSNQVLQLDLAKATEMAMKNNLGIQSQQLNLQSGQMLKKSAFELPKTEVGAQLGQYNSLNQDNNFNLRQSIPFPTVFSARSGLYNSIVQSDQLSLQATQNEITWRVQGAYGNILYLQEVKKQLVKLDSFYTDFAKAAALKYKTGESNLLEKTTAETKHAELQQLMVQNISQLTVAYSDLKMLIGYAGEIVITDNNIQPIQINATLDTSLISNNPALKNLYQQATIADKNKKLELAQTLPDFSVGYFSQTLIGYQTIDNSDVYFGSGKRFTGITLGIGIPLTFFSNSAKIKSIELQKQSLQRNADYGRLQLQTELKQALENYQKNLSLVNYYQQQASPNADLISSTAKKAYQSGEIGYVEYVQSLQTVSEIRIGYLKSISDLNQSAITINYLQGKF